MQKPCCKKKTLQIGLSEVEVCTLKGKSCIILDFGKELSGGARILTFLVEGDKTVRLRFGESVGETCSVIALFGLVTCILKR